ncbi:rhamnulokinase [candidate division KSB1 bacterium]|nr:rhamnulokinase [candidate division KSB1 bacterium]NIV70797.1 rhamnulokinase [Phycisphaerae bacterium]NIR72915.1 rhamnulokinase [candidate division KSB1 bacterium]NIT73713.1 rhamnulokinase [candidate division KSB1 bacterium]NIU27585.1 rhamnulokinase [candidate division KSB1 bacterium]
MNASHFVAFDLGAESGRTMLGTLADQRLSIKEVSRFPNGMINILGHLHWDIFRLFEEMKQGLQQCASELQGRPESLSVDTWGVDFALLAEDGTFLGLPFAYRDARTEGMMAEFHKLVPREKLYEMTGIQMLPFNSIYQLYAMSKANSSALQAAHDILFMPDAFNYLLTGNMSSEFTFATTSQLYNPTKGDWEDTLLEALGISRAKLQNIVAPGTTLGTLHESVTNDTGLEPIPVIACASHDTGSAVAAVPATGKDWAYLSSGTWSLMGVEMTHPVLTEQAMSFNFTNEGGVEGTFRFLKNIMGLWLVQQCKKSWDQDTPISYEELTRLAETAPPFRSMIDPDAPSFLNPPDMPEAMRLFCDKTGQGAPESHGEIVRCALESLALKYRVVLEQLRQIYPHEIKTIHVIGGGAKNELLCQFTANATGLPVVTGPTEATAIGNIMVQALAMGYVNSHAEIRQVIRNSFELNSYEPRESESWERAYGGFTDMLAEVNHAK